MWPRHGLEVAEKSKIPPLPGIDPWLLYTEAFRCVLYMNLLTLLRQYASVLVSPY
jgi:hypothetical protein